MISRSWPPAWKTFSTSSLLTNRSSSGFRSMPSAFGSIAAASSRACDLDQAEVRPVGVLAHELGVHGDEGLVGEAVDESL